MDDRERWNRKWEADGTGQAPSPFFERMCPSLVRRLRARPGARVLDLACGSGRHSLPPARAGIAVDAVDCSDVALGRLAAVAAREALALRTIRADLSNPREAARILARGGYDVVLDFFYLERALVPMIATALRPGGMLIFETRLTPGEPGSPANPKGYWLAPGELARLLRPHFEISAIGEKATHGKWLAQAVAIKR